MFRDVEAQSYRRQKKRYSSMNGVKWNVYQNAILRPTGHFYTV